MKRFVLPLVGLIVSFLILGYLFRQALASDQFEALIDSDKKWGLLVIGFVLGLTAICITFVRWYLLVRALDLPFHLMAAFRLGFIGYFLNFFTIGIVGGDALKAVFLVRLIPDRKTHSVASVLIDRVIGLFALFLVTTIAFVFSDLRTLSEDAPSELRAVQYVCYVAVAFTTAGILALILLQFASQLTPLMKRTFFRIPAIGGLFERLHMAATIYQRKQAVVFMSVVMSIVAHSINAVALYFIAAGLAGPHPDLLTHMVIVPMSMVAGSLPLPGGLGSFEFALDLLYRGVTATSGESEFGFVVALGYRVMTLLFAAIGVVLYFAAKTEIKDLIHQAKSLDEE